ncbi:hypothetical protein LENED_000107 [Lentinula edodes]|uniref:Uncharacterized protein n=1 Tax=Lentinula edodes TaxID=5353 RepID=A0A1Q3DUP3_LENED|nr:hypothetical protein LENED_000107 [Lentinula edodes]
MPTPANVCDGTQAESVSQLSSKKVTRTPSSHSWAKISILTVEHLDSRAMNEMMEDDGLKTIEGLSRPA